MLAGESKIRLKTIRGENRYLFIISKNENSSDGGGKDDDGDDSAVSQ